MPVRGGHTLEIGTPGRCVLILQSGYNDPSSSEESGLAMVAGSAAIHMLLSGWHGATHFPCRDYNRAWLR